MVVLAKAPAVRLPSGSSVLWRVPALCGGALCDVSCDVLCVGVLVWCVVLGVTGVLVWCVVLGITRHLYGCARPCAMCSVVFCVVSCMCYVVC